MRQIRFPSDLNAILCFARVVEHGGYTAAARAMQIPKQAVSRRVAQLEDDLGVRLLERSTRRVRVTEVGARFYEQARRMLDALDEGTRELQASLDHPRGWLRITAPATFAEAYMSDVFREFMERWPEVRLEAVLTQKTESLLAKRFDLAIRLGAQPDSTLVGRAFAAVPMACVAAPGYLQKNGVPKDPRALANHDCLVYAPVQRDITWAFSRSGRPLTVRPRARLLAGSMEVIARAASAGLGITVLPEFVVADALADGRLEPVLEDHHPPPVPVRAVYLSRKGLSVNARAFLDLLAERWDPTPW